MTVRAIDVITMLPRADEAARAQRQPDGQTAALHQAQAVRAQGQAERAQRQVTHAQDSKQVSIRKDGSGQQGAGGQPQGERKRSQEPPDESAPPGVGTNLDVKV